MLRTLLDLSSSSAYVSRGCFLIAKVAHEHILIKRVPTHKPASLWLPPPIPAPPQKKPLVCCGTLLYGISL